MSLNCINGKPAPEIAGKVWKEKSRISKKREPIKMNKVQGIKNN